MSRRPSLSGLVLTLTLAAVPAWARTPPEIEALNARLAALDADPALREQAAYERMQANQAIAAYDDVSRSQRPDALYVAQRRVEIAEVAAHAAVTARQADAFEQQKSALLLEASRREAERARQEAERLRVQAQIQAEEAERMRQEADAETQADAQAQADQALATATVSQGRRLTDAQKKDAALARQEAELVSGQKLPPSRFGDSGEVFTLAASVFQTGQAKLSDGGGASVKALAAYLNAVPAAKARIDGYAEGKATGAQRAAALRDALVAAGVAKSRLTVAAKGSGTKARSAEIAIIR
ncbi:MAG: hypothetical protein QM601_07015 [Pseudoxanthomonas sp.]